ncbi:hypothetical protein D9V32_05890 [Mycetocola tolaasinivorans]|uniref:Nuclear transport factor 2 family protein n=1 Tax=Mycetocola tolaasinivorans TaxID=76635 RepID=A0A3L7A7T9_9MICO|nr:hypothetical protein [Mycetocola tolaasinivorans]RLP76399.1 hypothetical protein D9V32_05890 [Mycetocola tolaasinivorans]
MIQANIAVDNSAVEGERVDVSLNNVVFEMVTSTTSVVAAEPTLFRYFENEGVVWGDYTGDTVIEGRFSGIREGDTLHMSYNHRSKNGNLVHGNDTTIVSRQADGLLRLTEFYVGANGEPQLSVCREVAAK